MPQHMWHTHRARRLPSEAIATSVRANPLGRETRAPTDREQARERPWKTARFTAKIIPRRVRGRARKTHASIRPAWSKKESTYVRTYVRDTRTDELVFGKTSAYISARASERDGRRRVSPRLFPPGRIDQGGHREAIIGTPSCDLSPPPSPLLSPSSFFFVSLGLSVSFQRNLRITRRDCAGGGGDVLMNSSRSALRNSFSVP